MLDNNAGITIDSPLHEATGTGVDKLIAVNFTGVTLGARAAYRYLKCTPGAQLANIASVVYRQPNIAVYSATKFYVAGLTEALSPEWLHEDIRALDIWGVPWLQTAWPVSSPGGRGLRPGTQALKKPTSPVNCTKGDRPIREERLAYVHELVQDPRLGGDDQSTKNDGDNTYGDEEGAFCTGVIRVVQATQGSGQ